MPYEFWFDFPVYFLDKTKGIDIGYIEATEFEETNSFIVFNRNDVIFHNLSQDFECLQLFKLKIHAVFFNKEIKKEIDYNGGVNDGKS